jgi:hypothetical protein
LSRTAAKAAAAPGVKGGIAAAIGLVALAALACQNQVTAAPAGKDAGTPKEAAYDHVIRLKVVRATPVERTDQHELLELRVQRWYGRADQKSLERNQKHETQEFTILFPAAPGAAVKAGDIIDYRAVRFVANQE